MKRLFTIILIFLAVHSLNAQLRVLPVGESTTDGGPSYRRKFCELLTADGASFDMVGPKDDGAATYDGDHAGYSGSPSDAVQVQVVNFSVSIQADVVLVWEGTNDCGWACVGGDTTNLGKLVDKIVQLYPNAHVFVGSIPPMSYNAYESAEHGRLAGVAQANGVIFNGRLPELVQRRINAGKKVHFVDASSLTLADVTSDGIHPNQQGYDKMGTLFYNAVKPLLDPTPPSAPTNLASSVITNNSFTLSWTASTDNVGVTGYIIYKDGVAYDTTTNTTINITNVGPGRTYSMTVKATDAVANLSTAATISVTTTGTIDNVVPSKPTNLSSSLIAPFSFTLSWTAATDNDAIGSYEIFKDGISIGKVISPATSMSITKLVPSSTYSVTVKAIDRSGNISVLSDALSVTTAVGPSKYEAEDAVLAGGVKKATNHTGYSGTGFIDFFEVVGTSATFTVGVPTAGAYDVSLHFCNSMGTDRTLTIYVNGVRVKQTTLPNLASWDTWSDKVEMLSLQAGANTISYRYDNADNGFVNLDYINVSKSTSDVTDYEAENAQLSGGAAVVTNHTGFTGTGFVAQMETEGATVTFTVGVTNSATYAVALRYCNSMGSTRTLSLYVNSVKVKQISLLNLASWDTWGTKIETVNLTAGSNTIAYVYDVADNGFVNLDNISLSVSNDAVAPTVPTNLAVSAITQTSFDLSWTASTDNVAVDVYEIFSNGKLMGIVNANTTSFTVTGLAPSNTYSVKVRAKDAATNASDTSAAKTATTLAAGLITRYEAEYSVFGGSAGTAKNHANYSGTGFVEGWGAFGTSTLFNINVASSGDYNITAGYANGWGANGTLSLLINGVKMSQMILPATANWETWGKYNEIMTLDAGNNTVEIRFDAGDNGGINLDYIEISPATNIENIENNLISVYPNPVVDGKMMINIDAFITGNTTLVLYNQLGVEVYSQIVNSIATAEIQLPESIAKGIYILKATNNSTNYVNTIEIK